MRANEQNLEAGDGSTNVQAGHDVHMHGLTLSEARQVALDVYRANALELQGVAQAVAIARAEELTNEFLDKLNTETPERVGRLSDPDVQSVLFDAQKEYARAGEEDLRRALVDLLASRAGEEERNLRALALNEAIISAAKLTESQRRAVAFVFYARHTRPTHVGTVEELYNRVGPTIETLGAGLPTKRADYQHIEYVGAGAVSIASVSFAATVRSGVEGLFTTGFPESEVDESLLASLRTRGLIMPCIRNSANLQLTVLGTEDLDDRLGAAGWEGDAVAVRALMNKGMMTDEQVVADAISKRPALASVQDAWEDETTGLKNLTLTSVGLALGHAYWTRVAGGSAPLSVWL